MITRQELKELAVPAHRGSHFVSLYLNVDPRDNPKSDWLLHFKSLARDAQSKLKPKEREQVKHDLAGIERFLNDRPKGMRRGLAVFSSQALEYWKVFHTAFPFSNQLVIDRDPYIKPLAAMVDLYQRYLVVVVGGTEARLLLAGMGRIAELTAVSRPGAPADPTRDGRIGDMGAVRAQRHKEHVQKQLFKDLELLVDRTLREEYLKRILLGGTENARGRFRESLAPAMREKVVAEFAVEHGANSAQVLERCLPLMKEVEFKFERKALAELFDQTGAREGSVLGLSDVLTALQQGNVRKLYVMSNMAAPGMACNRCGALTPERDKPCPYCESEMTQVNYMLDLAIQKAMEQGAGIDMIDNSPELTKAGGIGAQLRY